MDGTTRWLLVMITVGWVPVCFSSHFRGAIITWKPGDRDRHEIIIDFRISWRMSFNRYFHCDADTIASGNLIGNGDTLSCFKNCVGKFGSVNYKCTDFSNTEDWSSGRGTAIFRYPANGNYFEFGYTGTAWIKLNQGGNNEWTLRVAANLTTRPDNTINSSPVVEIPPIVRLQWGCNHTIVLPVSDPDGDIVRCRWASSQNNECGSICGGFPHSFMRHDACEIIYEAKYSTGWYGLAVQVEDYLSPNSTKPLSSIPVQFLVYVFKSTDTTCNQTTKFISPTPPDGACIGVPNNTTYEATIAAQVANGNRSITSIQTISPVGLTKSSVSKAYDRVWQMNVTWTPATTGSIQNTFCFTAEDSAQSRSEKECISLLSGVNPPEFDNASSYLKSEVEPTQHDWTITVNMEVVETHRHSFIRIFHAANDTEVEAIDASDTAQVTVDSAQQQLHFQTSVDLAEKEEYYILFDFGVVRSRTYCGVESKEETDPYFWRFKIRDVTPPHMTRRAVPGITNSTAHVSWLYDEPVVTVCHLEDPRGHKSVVPCNTSWSGTQLQNGNYLLRVQATDLAGNKDVLETLAWTVDTVPPVVTLTSYPAKVSNETSVEFNWVSSEASTARCRLVPSDWTDCHPSYSIHVQVSASGKEQSFEVQATDTVGNVGDIVSYNWTADFDPPIITLCEHGTRLNVSCQQDLQPQHICAAYVTDNIDKRPTLTFKDTGASSPHCDIRRTWTSRDAAGNTVSVDQIIHVTVDKPIHVLKAPGQISIACGTLQEQELENVLIGSFEVEHPCGLPLTYSYKDTPDTEECDVLVSRTWTISDSCGNAKQISQPIKVMHVHNPLSPENGQIGTDLSLYLRWPASGAQTKYEVFYWEKTASRPSQPETVTNYNFYELSSLKSDTQYLWQVVFSFSKNDTFVGPVWGFQTRKYADLVVVSSTVPSTGYSGQAYEIQWTVMNVGKLPAQRYWYDAVYLSFTTDQFSEAALQSTVYQHNIIMPNDGYSSKSSVKFGDNQFGTAFFFIKTNVDNNVEELNTTNNLIMKSMEVTLTPPPDLTVLSVITPKSTYSGHVISIRWTVVNNGQGSTVTGRWSDKVWWSKDKIIDSSDSVLQYASYNGDLTPGMNYTMARSVLVPGYITGDYYVLIETDCFNNVFEFNSEGNNVNSSQSAVHVILTPPPDLEVTTVTVPESLMTGDTLTVTWQVTNKGVPVPRSQPYWRDKVEISSTSTVWTRTLQYRGHYGALGPSVSYTAKELFPVTADIPSGVYIVTVTTNYDHRLFEYTNTGNNEKSSHKMVITKALPNLHVYKFTLDVIASSETAIIQAAWNVGNIGHARTLSNSWTDTLRLTFLQKFGNTILLQPTVDSNTALLPGKTYERSQNFSLSPQIYGNVEITLTVDDLYPVTGDGDRRDNVEGRSVYIPLYAPDLQILGNVSVSENIVGGKPLTIMYTVQNVGNKEVNNTTWIDEVLISAKDDNYDCGATCKIKNYQEMRGSLSQNGTYTVTSQFMLPESMSGPYLVSIIVDYHSDIFEGPNKGNNKMTTEIEVKAAPKADLSLLHVQSKLTGQTGEDKILNIEWRVKNTGNSMKTLKSWVDSVGFISNGNSTQFTVLDSFQVLLKLGASSEYFSNKTVIVPSYIDGLVQFCIYADSSSQLKEAFSKQDNFLCEERQTTIKKPLEAKLQATVTDVKAAKDGYTAPGAELYISFTVVNSGDLSTAESSWIDSVYIINTAATSVEQLKAVGTSVAEITHVGKLEAKEQYSVTQIITIPSTFSGNVMLYILPNNSYGAVYAGITGISGPSSGSSMHATAVAANFTTILLVPGLLPNIFIQTNATLRELSGGQPVIVEYEITNNGSAAVSRYWYDAVYISDDYLLDVFDTKLITALRTESIDVNETIQQNITFTLPLDMETKSYFLIFQCDSRDDIFEENEKDNEVRLVFQLQQRTSTDIYVTNVQSPKTASYSHMMEVNWTVMNNGSKTASGYKCDSAYLSDDDTWDITDSLVGKPQCASFTLMSNTSVFQTSVTAKTPAVAAGSYNTLVKSRSNILDVNQDNNVAVAKIKTEVTINPLILGTSENGTLLYNGLMLFHVPNVSLEETLVVNVTSDCTHCFNLFVKGGFPAKLYDFEQTSTNLNQKYAVLTIPDTHSPDYYILIQNTDTHFSQHEISVSVKIAKFEILEVFPSHMMKEVDVTLRIQGTLFPDNLTASLENKVTNEIIEATRIYPFSGTEIFATFNIPGDTLLTNGTLRLQSPLANKTTVFSRAIPVTAGIAGYLTTSLSPLGKLLNGKHGFISLTIENNGDSDILVPLILVQATGEGDIRYIDKNNQHVYKQEYFLIGSSETGPGGILPPKAYSRFHFEALQNVELGRVKFSANMEVAVSTITADKNIANPFVNQKASIRPTHYDAKSWEPVWNNFVAMTGNNTHSLVTKISKVLNEMSIVSHRTWMVDDMVRYLLDMADSPMGDKMDVVATDVALETDLTVGLVISRHLSSRIGSRSQTGPMGRGWILPLWDTKIKAVNGDLMVVTIAKKDAMFVKTEEGLYWNLKAGKIWVSGNEYILMRLNDKQQYHFDVQSLKLISVVSLRDVSRIDLTYTDNKLTQIKHSRGSYISVSYDTLGRIASMEVGNTSVPLTRQDSHILYEYALEGNTLTAAVVGGKRTRYDYNYDSSIRFITYSDNSMHVYEYSRMGHTTAKRFVVHNAQVSGTEYRYHDSGIVTVTALPGNFVTNVTFDEDGEIILIRRDKYLPVKTVKTRGLKTDLEGNFVLTKRQFCSDQKSVKIEDGNGDSIELFYNDFGQLWKFLDGGKNKYKFAYDNTTGNLNSATYPDGSNITYTYTGHKQYIKNQNGAVKTLEFNERNQLITKATGNDHITSFEYDSAGRLQQAISKDDMIRLAYDGNNPREITYSDATIHYEHNKNGQIQKVSTDGDYAVEYVYDDDGNVKQVIDGSDNNALVEVSYTETGKIKKKLFGNNASAVYEYDGDTDLLKELRNYYPNGTVATYFKYAYSPRQRRISMETKEGVWKFEYDTAGQVTMMASPDGSVTRFLYDNRKNRKTVSEGGSEKHFTVNSMNQYETYGSTKFAYDKNGNMVQKNGTESTAYSFDEDNKLLELKTGTHNCSFEYDALGTLKAKVCNGVRTRYLTDPFGYMGNTIIEQITDGERLQMYYGGEQIGLIGLKDKNGMNYFQYDPIGSVVGILNQNGDLLNAYQSDPFGQVLQSHESLESPFTFIGQWGVLHVKESSDIYLMRARVYDSEIGRFLSLDPDGLSARSKNFYAYCSNNPVQCRDPEGTWLWIAAKIGWGGVKEGFKYWYTHHNDGSFTWGGFAGATVEGTLDGVIGSLPIPSAVGTFLEGGAHVIGSGLEHLINHEKYTGRQAWHDYRDFEVNAWEDKALEKITGGLLPSWLRKKLENAPGWVKNTFEGTNFALPKLGKAVGLVEFWAHASFPIFHPLDPLKKLGNKAASELYHWVLSKDPNDITGPKGYGAARFIAGDQKLTYKIEFENEENATAPAQRVYIELKYSKHLDPRSFVMGSFGFGDVVQEIPDGSKLFQGSINMTSEFGIFVSVVAGLDPSNQMITWEFQSLDPATGEAPTDASTGFLPPNNGTSGQGYVSFMMKPEADSPHLAVINTNASIYFDENEPIDTPNIFNTIDKKAPTANGSVVQQFLTSGTAAVQLSADDSGSGVEHVDLFLKQGDSIILLQAGITDTVVALPLQPGANYTLLPMAVDHVGNKQSLDTVDEESWILLEYLVLNSSCNCSDHGNCSEGTTVCLCDDGYYGEQCDSVVPPHEPPILDVRASAGTQGKPVELFLSAQNQSGPIQDMSITVTGFPQGTVFSSGSQTELDSTTLILDYFEFGPVNMTTPDSFYGKLTLHVEVNETSGELSVTRTGELLITIYPDTSKAAINIHGCFFSKNHQTAVRLNATVLFSTSNFSIPYSMGVTLPPWAFLEGMEPQSGNSYPLQDTDSEYVILTQSHFQPFNVTVGVSFSTLGTGAISRQYEINAMCTECPNNTYGIKCDGHCACNVTNTLECDKFDGACLCRSGYTAAKCDEDIDECAQNTSLCDGLTHRDCYNTPGSYRCLCKDGYRNNGGNCTECSGFTYGLNCFLRCPCNSANTVSCNHANGTCHCKKEWTGAHCDVDVDECSSDKELCKGRNNTVCQNKAGAYDCLCRRGFQLENDSCTEIPKTVSPTVVTAEDGDVKETPIEVRFNIYIPSTDNLDAAYTYKKYEREASQVLSSYYRLMLGVGFVRVVIVDLRHGSLVVDHEVVTRNHAFVLQELGYAINELAQKPNMTFFNQTVTVEDVAVDKVPVKGSENDTGQPDNPCKSFTAISPCRKSEECVVEQNLPTCRSVQVVVTKTENKDDSDDGKRNRTILLSIFIPIGVLMMIFVVCVARTYCKHDTTKEDISTESDNLELQSRLNRSEGHKSADTFETSAQLNPTYNITVPRNQDFGSHKLDSTANPEATGEARRDRDIAGQFGDMRRTSEDPRADYDNDDHRTQDGNWVMRGQDNRSFVSDTGK